MVLIAQKTQYLAYPAHPKTIGEHIKKKRIDLGLLQREVAEMIGSSKNVIGGWESNSHEVRVRFIPGIIRFLGYIPFEIGSSQQEQLIAYRKIRGLTQEQLSKEWQIERGCLERWENGVAPRKKIFRAKIEGIADHLIKERKLELYQAQ